jgi:hypothetical protein
MARPAAAVTPNTDRALQCEPISRAPGSGGSIWWHFAGLEGARLPCSRLLEQAACYAPPRTAS